MSSEPIQLYSMYFYSALLTCLQYVDTVALSAPFRPTMQYFVFLHPLEVSLVDYGAVAFGESTREDDRYAELKEMGLLREVTDRPLKDLTAEMAKERVLERREAFQLRQQIKRSNQLPKSNADGFDEEDKHNQEGTLEQSFLVGHSALMIALAASKDAPKSFVTAPTHASFVSERNIQQQRCSMRIDTIHQA